MEEKLIHQSELFKLGLGLDEREYSDKKVAHKAYKKLVKRWKRGGVFELPNVGGFAIHSSDVLYIRFGKEG